MRALPLLLVAMSLAVPGGMAGTEARPEINDSPLDGIYERQARPDLDILRVWFERDGGSMTATMSLATATELEPDTKYVIFFSSTNGRRWLSMTVGESGEPAWGTGIYQGQPFSGGPCPQESDPYIMFPVNQDVTGEFTADSPAYVSMSIRLKDAGFGEGDQLRSPFALTYVDEGECNQLTDITGEGKIWNIPAKPNFLQRLLPGFGAVPLLVAAAALVALGRKK